MPQVPGLCTATDPDAAPHLRSPDLPEKPTGSGNHNLSSAMCSICTISSKTLDNKAVGSRQADIDT
jgi:hypothetical protein